MNTSSHRTDSRVIEARLGSRLASVLSAPALAHDVGERLRVAREQALARAREVRRAAPGGGLAVLGVSGGGVAMLGDFVPWWQRAASVLPLLVLVAGLVAIDQWSTHEQVLAAADIDAQLLSDDLPPAAYSDPGFAEFLRDGPTP
jgi:Protein of unknown function (DUF3619)